MAKDISHTRQDRALSRKSNQDRNLFNRITAAGAAGRANAQKLLKQAGGLSIVEWRVLWDLTEAGPLSVRDMADIQRYDHSLISRALPQMQAKGYVTLSQDQTDKRQTLVALTDAGHAAFTQAAPGMKARRARLDTVFTQAEKAQFLDLIERFEASLCAPAPHRPQKADIDEQEPP